MAHSAQYNFFNSIKEKYPEYFKKVKVLDCGSLDVNGSAKNLFEDSAYTGVDIVAGKNVDIVSMIKDLDFPNNSFDVVVSGEMLEHDETWKASLKKMYDLVKPKGLLLISCAGTGRAVHGTMNTNGKIWGTSPNYYMNLGEEEFREVYKDNLFTESEYRYNAEAKDSYFYGIKK
jgi:SAM-dependent methyltransferase